MTNSYNATIEEISDEIEANQKAILRIVGDENKYLLDFHKGKAVYVDEDDKVYAMRNILDEVPDDSIEDVEELLAQIENLEQMIDA